MSECYIVRVQDIGEVYNYAYHTLEEAQHLMAIENLPYSLWVRKANGEEEELSGNHDPVLHIHEYQRDNFINRPGRLLTDAEKKKYKRFFRRVKL